MLITLRKACMAFIERSCAREMISDLQSDVGSSKPVPTESWSGLTSSDANANPVCHCLLIIGYFIPLSKPKKIQQQQRSGSSFPISLPSSPRLTDLVIFR